MSSAVLQLADIYRGFDQGGRRLEVLRGANLTVNSGELVALVGPSGAGKSTLLHIAGLLEHPDAGDVFIGGEDCTGAGDKRLTEMRCRYLGFVYQFHHLLPEFSALENIVLPQMIAGTKKPDAMDRAADLLQLMGLEDRMDHRPAQMSGGEQQRAAIARAMANHPRLILADEPTGNLDPKTADRVFQTLVTAAREQGVSALIATHNMTLAKRMDRLIYLEDGLLKEHS